jgi:NAD-dependent SIR2 family protein deacetylase
MVPTKPVVILGAGATKACNGPLTNELLPQVFQLREAARQTGDSDALSLFDREEFINLLDDFLTSNFHVPPAPAARQTDDYPALPLLLSLVDTAIDRRQALGPGWDPPRLRDVREALEYAVFAVLDHQLQHTTNDLHFRFLDRLYRESGTLPSVVSLNYDIIVDNTLARVIAKHIDELHPSGGGGPGGFPSYECDVATGTYRQWPKFGKLLKIHGSLNWLYCPGCHRLDIGVSNSGSRTCKVLELLYYESPLEGRYSCRGSPCPDCKVFVRPVMITPTHHKDYRNPHVAQVWYQAERALREADRVFIIGYSLPDDDVEVAYLLKRGLAHLPPEAITVVEYDPPTHRGLRDHPVGRRYRTLFGEGLDWQTGGFGDWLAAYEQHNGPA